MSYNLAAPTHPEWCTRNDCAPNTWGDVHHQARPVTVRPALVDAEVTVTLSQDDVAEWDGTLISRTGVELTVADARTGQTLRVVLGLADAQQLGHNLLIAMAEAIGAPGAADAEEFAQRMAADNRAYRGRR